MWLIDELAEARIAEAQRLGVFDELPGGRARVDLGAEELVPEDLRVAYRMLKNAGYVPPEVTLLREIREVEQLMLAMDDDGKSRAARKLNLLRAQLGARARNLDSALQYSARIRRRFDGE